MTTLSQVPGARDKAERAERAVVAHLNMTSAEGAQRSTVLVSEQRLAHAATAAGASARRRSAGTAGPDELEVSCGRSRVQAAQPHRLLLAVRRRRGAQIPSLETQNALDPGSPNTSSSRGSIGLDLWI